MKPPPQVNVSSCFAEAGKFHSGRPPPSFGHSMTHEPTLTKRERGRCNVELLRFQGAGASVW